MWYLGLSAVRGRNSRTSLGSFRTPKLSTLCPKRCYFVKFCSLAFTHQTAKQRKIDVLRDWLDEPSKVLWLGICVRLTFNNIVGQTLRGGFPRMICGANSPEVSSAQTSSAPSVKRILRALILPMKRVRDAASNCLSWVTCSIDQNTLAN